MSRMSSKYKEVVAAATCTDVHVTDPEKIELIPRFIEQDVIERLESGQQLTINNDLYRSKIELKHPQWSKIADTEPQQKTDPVNVVELTKQEGIDKLTLDDVQYFKRDNVGDKTRWYKLEEIDRPHGVICMAKNIEPDAKKYFLQALLVQMDNKLHQRFEKDLKQAYPGISEVLHHIS
jgi:hypothetical protein